MKNMLIAALIAGTALAGVILYLTGGFKNSPRKIINVEDGTPLEA